MPESVKVFLSTVSDEFRAYRDQLRTDLTRHNVEVKVQEDFKDLGGDTLDKLDVYIAHCDCVVHFVGDMTGSAPLKRDVDALLAKHPDLVADLPPLGEALRDGAEVSYTQWEAWLALYHQQTAAHRQGRRQSRARTEICADGRSRAAQAEHLARLQARRAAIPAALHQPGQSRQARFRFGDSRPAGESGPREPPRRPKNLPFASLGSLFKGREEALISCTKR